MLPPLTMRERQVAAGMLEDKTHAEIAADLRVSRWTVVAHLRTLAAKLGGGRPRVAVERHREALEEGTGEKL